MFNVLGGLLVVPNLFLHIIKVIAYYFNKALCPEKKKYEQKIQKLYPAELVKASE